MLLLLLLLVLTPAKLKTYLKKMQPVQTLTRLNLQGSLLGSNKEMSFKTRSSIY